MRNHIVTLLTDFGTKDHYVASMKGIILGINPQCTLVDITHHVSPQDIEEGAFILANAYGSFPKETIHLAIVDPGVGGQRRPILVQTGNYFFWGPDNGLFTRALKKEEVKRVVVLTKGKYFLPRVSNTFHGRDLFAPVAGHLSLGVDPANFGHKMESWTELPFSKPRIIKGKLIGKIVHIDTFGNLISNIDEGQFSGFTRGQSFVVRIGEARIEGVKKGYWEGKKDEPIALIGSGGFLEISVREGNAQKKLRVRKGNRVIVECGLQIEIIGF
jgi:S-adenosylmethionine hydrolase